MRLSIDRNWGWPWIYFYRSKQSKVWILWIGPLEIASGRGD